VYSSEVLNAREPQAKELVCPAIALKHMQCQRGIVVDGVDDDLHQVNLQRLDLGLIVRQDLHGQRDELGNVVVNVATHVEHDDLGKLTAADSIDTSNLVVFENGSNHIDDCVEVRAVLDQCLGSIVDKILKSR
jgi:hypothetical protein